MTFNIFTYGNGDVMYQIFTGIALLMGAGYESLVRVGLGLLAIGLIGVFVIQRRMLGSVLIGVLLILGTALAIRVSVIVQDLVNPFIPDRVVGNVPLAVAFPAYVQSEVGYRLMVLAQSALSIPSEYQMTSTTFARPFYDLQKLMAMSLPEGDLEKNVMGYMKDCVFLEIGMDQLLLEDIMKSGDALTDIETDNFTLMTWQFQNGNPTTQISCPQMYSTVVVPGLAYGNADYEKAMTDLRRALSVQDIPNEEETPIGQDLTAVLGSGQTARQAINTLLIRQEWLNAEQRVNVDKNDQAAAVSNMQTQIQKTLKMQAYAQSYVAAKFIPMLRTIAEAGTYTLTPFIIAAAFVPGMFRVLGLGVKTYLWLLLWAPIYVVINFVVYTYGSSLLNGLGTVSMDSFPRLDDTLLTLNSFASQVVWAVPIIAAAVAWGTGSLANAFMSGAVGAQLVAGREAEAYAHGQGAVLREGRQYETQSVPVFDGDGHVQYASVPYGAGGMVIDHQSGIREVLHSDGGRTALSPNGVETYSGPSGHYSRKGEYYNSGAFRHKDYDPTSGQIVNMQTLVMGSGLKSDYVYRDKEGIEQSVSQLYDQDSQTLQSRTAQSWKDGVQLTDEMGPDGSHKISLKGVASLFLHEGNSEEYVGTGIGVLTAEGRQAPGAQHPTWGKALFESTIDGKTQVLKGNLSGDRDDLHFFVTEGDMSNVLKSNIMDHGWAVQQNIDPRTQSGVYDRRGAMLVRQQNQGKEEVVFGTISDHGMLSKDESGQLDYNSTYAEFKKSGGERTDTLTGVMLRDEQGEYFHVVDGLKNSGVKVLDVMDKPFEVEGRKYQGGELSQAEGSPGLHYQHGYQILGDGQKVPVMAEFSADRGKVLAQTFDVGDRGRVTGGRNVGDWTLFGSFDYSGQINNPQAPVRFFGLAVGKDGAQQAGEATFRNDSQAPVFLATQAGTDAKRVDRDVTSIVRESSYEGPFQVPSLADPNKKVDVMGKIWTQPGNPDNILRMEYSNVGTGRQYAYRKDPKTGQEVVQVWSGSGDPNRMDKSVGEWTELTRAQFESENHFAVDALIGQVGGELIRKGEKGQAYSELDKVTIDKRKTVDLNYTSALMEAYEAAGGHVDRENLGFWRDVLHGSEYGRLALHGANDVASLALRMHQLKQLGQTFKKGDNKRFKQDLDQVMEEWRSGADWTRKE